MLVYGETPATISYLTFSCSIRAGAPVNFAIGLVRERRIVVVRPSRSSEVAVKTMASPTLAAHIASIEAYERHEALCAQAMEECSIRFFE
jgi:hypothetical protein